MRENMTLRNLSSVARFLRISPSAARFTRIVRACWAICCAQVNTSILKVFDSFAYRAILDKNLEVPDWQRLTGLEDGRLRCRKRNEVFNGNGPDLWIWAGDEAHKLDRYQDSIYHTRRSNSSLPPLVL